MSINTTLLTQGTKPTLKQTSIISGNQAEEDLHTYHLEALYNLHANETGFYLKKNLLKHIGSILRDQKKLHLLSGNAYSIFSFNSIQELSI